jgi:hypothetical protein
MLTATTVENPIDLTKSSIWQSMSGKLRWDALTSAWVTTDFARAVGFITSTAVAQINDCKVTSVLAEVTMRIAAAVPMAIAYMENSWL